MCSTELCQEGPVIPSQRVRLDPDRDLIPIRTIFTTAMVEILRSSVLGVFDRCF